MKTTILKSLKLSGIVLTSSVILFSCGASKEEMEEREAAARSLADSVSTTIQNIPKKQPIVKADSERVFVRKADMYFKVKDVQSATFDIERIVNEHNGYVTSSMLESTTNYKNSVRISKDSVLDMTNYSVHNDIVLRIPNTELDKTLSEIASLIDYLEYRKIKADDVTKEFQSAKLSENRFVNHKKRLENAIDSKGKKLTQTVDAENDLLSKQEMADNTKINTMELAHDVSFSTVNISIYQRETTKKEMYAYALPIEPYEPTYLEKVGDSVKTGANFFGEIILFFIKLWPFVFLVIGIVFSIKLITRKKWFA